MHCKQKKNSRDKIRKLLTQQIRTALPIGLAISLSITKKTKFKTEANNFLRFSYSWGHRLQTVPYLTETEIYTLKSKTTTKLNSKQTSIATIRDLYRIYATFPDPPWFSLQTTFKGLVAKLFSFYIYFSFVKYCILLNTYSINIRIRIRIRIRIFIYHPFAIHQNFYDSMN
jgi:hypothetical protein